MLAGKSDGGGAGAWTLIGLLLVTSQCGAGAPTSLRSQHDDEAKPAAAAAESPLVRNDASSSSLMLAGLTKAALQAPQKHRAKRDGCLPPDDYHGYPDGDNEYDLCEDDAVSAVKRSIEHGEKHDDDAAAAAVNDSTESTAQHGAMTSSLMVAENMKAAAAEPQKLRAKRDLDADDIRQLFALHGVPVEDDEYSLPDDYAYDEDASFEDSQRVPYDHRYDNESPWRYGSNDDNYYYDDDTEEGRPKRVEDDEEAEEEYSEYENEAEREALRELLAERAAEEARLALLAYLTSGEPKYRSDEPQYLVDPSAEELALEEEDYNALMSEPDDLYDEEPPPEEENLLDAPEKRNSFYPYSYEPYGGRWGALVPGTKRGDRDPYDRLYRLAEVLSRPAQLDYDEK